MRRWLPWFLLPVLACLGICAHRCTDPSLLLDSDTSVLIQALRARHAPLSWFAGDWPLQNHFYRPVSTLTFELDQWLHPGDAAGFGLTNALLAMACVLLLFWLVRESVGVPWIAGVSSGLFGLWHLGGILLAPLEALTTFLAGLSLIGFFRGGKATVLIGALGLAFLSQLWEPTMAFDSRIVSWLPGRTASTMLVFALTSMASYARYERLSAPRLKRKASPTDLPATKGTEVVTERARSSAWLWLVAAVIAEVFALGAYEQAVMLPLALLGLALLFRWQDRTPRWKHHWVFWAVFMLYAALRLSLVPSVPSGYQLQQFRHGSGVVVALADYLIPAWNWLRELGAALTVPDPWILWLTITPWAQIAVSVGNITTWWQVRRDVLWAPIVSFFALATLTFLPMAWLQPFGHYHYWPSAMRAVFVVGLAAASLRGFASAVSLPALQAPQRRRPAPGSLPRL